jgi:ABC-type polysaccharide/polyol phosphate export permease
MIENLRQIWNKRTILRHLVSVQLTTSYRTKSFGFLWALLDPLLFMSVYYLVFGMLIAHRPRSFMLHIYVGVIGFRFLNTCMSQAAGILRGQSGLIREIAFPKACLPLSVVIARIFDFGAGWIAAIFIALIFDVPVTPFWLLVPALIVVQALFVTGVTLVIAYVGVFFADISNILSVVQRLWFYLTPVLYPLELIRTKAISSGHPFLYDLYRVNPMVGILGSFEAVTQKAHLPGAHSIMYALGWGLLTFLIGMKVFSRVEGHIAKYL